MTLKMNFRFTKPRHICLENIFPQKMGRSGYIRYLIMVELEIGVTRGKYEKL